MTLITRELLSKFSALQFALISEFFEIFPSAGQDFMRDVPKNGEISVKGEMWQFRKHGQGVRFYHPESGRIVDSHRFYGGIFDVIDAWRIMQFAESVGMSALTEQAIEDSLMLSVRSGILRQIGHARAYRLISPIKPLRVQ